MSFLSAFKNNMEGRNWHVFLVTLSFLLLLINVALFYPGYMSPDTIDSLGQALGTYALHDWHPVYFVFLWKALIFITGTPATMLLLILLLEWVAWGSLAIFIYRITGSRRVSLLPIFFGLTPIVLNVSGVIWKDVLMANFLAVGFVLSLWLYSHKNRRWPKGLQWVVFSASLLCFVSAALLRYNAIPALIPLLWFLCMSIEKLVAVGKKKLTLIVAGMLFVVCLLSFALPIAMRAISTNPVNAVMFDDIIHVTKKQDWERGLPPDLRWAIVNATEICNEKSIVFNAYIVCTTQAEKDIITKRYPQEVKQLWLDTVFHNILSYTTYRVHTFSLQLLAPDRLAYVWQDGIVNNEYGQQVRSNEVQAILKLYVLDFGYRYFPFLFAGWFWLLVAGVLLYYVRRLQFNGAMIAVLSSGIIYIVAYIPITVAADYRYIYWLVFSCLIASCLFIASTHNRGDYPKKIHARMKIRKR